MLRSPTSPAPAYPAVRCTLCSAAVLVPPVVPFDPWLAQERRVDFLAEHLRLGHGFSRQDAVQWAATDAVPWSGAGR
ncbi:MAG TPA: hypothetical protein VK066_12325 [Chloroflexota bacterium]|nr:hypothetical protein [Chloroflexota bacterium]